MVNNDFASVLLIWGVWLLIPIVVDGLSTVWHLWMALPMLRRKAPLPLPKTGLPKVSIVIPAYNERLNIDSCLLSLRAQTYPHYLIEIIVVDDGSDDGTANAVMAHMGEHQHRRIGLRTNAFSLIPGEFGGVLNLVRRKRDRDTYHGKPAAVNAGLALATGELIIAIDSDVALEPDAIEQTVRTFLADETLVAATGHLIIDPYLAVETDVAGNVKMGGDGLPVPQELTWFQRVLTACQFLEYLTAFHLGRRSEGMVDSLFTISGACAAFRREAFVQVGNYRGRTVCEDTDMTMALHRLPGRRVGYMPNVRVHLAPTLTLSALYAQRTRWQRGALEVSALHIQAKRKDSSNWLFWRIALPLRLQMDHTMALPRLTWTFLIFMLPLFGYSWDVVLEAMLLLMLFYLCLNAIRTLVGYAFSCPPEKVFVRKYLSYLPVWPLYNMFLYWVRLSAEIRTLTENPEWTVETPLLEKLETLNLEAVGARLIAFLIAPFL